MSTFVIAVVADDVAACCDGKFSLVAGGKEAGIAAYPRRHLNTCKRKQQISLQKKEKKKQHRLPKGCIHDNMK